MEISSLASMKFIIFLQFPANLSYSVCHCFTAGLSREGNNFKASILALQKKKGRRAS